MKRIMAIGMAVMAWAGVAAAQDVPGFAAGAFYEHRIDNRVADENLEFDYVGGRIQFRDERWFTVFADLGSQSGEWGDADSDSAGFFGLGGTFWLYRAEDLLVPLDLGVAGSYHQGDVDVDLPGGTVDATYSTWTLQGVVRASGFVTGASPYLKAGVRRSVLDGTGLDDDDWDVQNPAIHAGVEFLAAERLVLTIEGNYSEGFGFAVRADLWF